MGLNDIFCILDDFIVDEKSHKLIDEAKLISFVRSLRYVGREKERNGPVCEKQYKMSKG